MLYRAVLEFTNNEAGNALYLHWDGARENVEGILRVARELELPDNDEGHKTLHAWVDEQLQNAYFDPLYKLQGSADGAHTSNNGTYIVGGYRVTGRNNSCQSIKQIMRKDAGYDKRRRAARGQYIYDRVMAHPEAQARLAALKAQREAHDLNDALPPANPSTRMLEDLGAPDPQPVRSYRPRL